MKKVLFVLSVIFIALGVASERRKNRHCLFGVVTHKRQLWVAQIAFFPAVQFVKKLEINPNAYIFAVAMPSLVAGHACEKLEELLVIKGDNLSYGAMACICYCL